MQPFVYRAQFETGDRRGWFVVTFPDVPEAITDGKGMAAALRNAEEALGLALLSYVHRVATMSTIGRRATQARTTPNLRRLQRARGMACPLQVPHRSNPHHQEKTRHRPTKRPKRARPAG